MYTYSIYKYKYVCIYLMKEAAHNALSFTDYI